MAPAAAFENVALALPVESVASVCKMEIVNMSWVVKEERALLSNTS